MQNEASAVRTAYRGDAAALVLLLSELGYPGSEAEVTQRLDALLPREDSGVLVLEADEPGVLAGFVSFHLVERFATGGRQCRITAFCVASAARRAGVGRALLAAVESEARIRGCDRMEVTSGDRPEREPAHAFYADAGYVEKPRRFLKKL